MKIAFIGVGGIAGNYRRSLKQLEHPIAAVCDINAERVATIAAEEMRQHTPTTARCYRKKSQMLCLPVSHRGHIRRRLPMQQHPARHFLSLNLLPKTWKLLNTHAMRLRQQRLSIKSVIWRGIATLLRKRKTLVGGSETCYGIRTVSGTDGGEPSMVGNIRGIARTDGGADNPRF